MDNLEVELDRSDTKIVEAVGNVN